MDTQKDQAIDRRSGRDRRHGSDRRNTRSHVPRTAGRADRRYPADRRKWPRREEDREMLLARPITFPR